ncbi:MAG: hypothetical protein AABY09_00230, partial [Nanoarchaeota archaeon]
MRMFKSLALALALGTSSCFVYDKPEKHYPHYYEEEGERWFYKDYEFRPARADDIRNKNFLPLLHPGYEPKPVMEKDQQGNKVNAIDFVRRSNSQPEARSYVQAGLETIMAKHEQGKIRGDEAKLADYAISLFRQDISKDNGRGRYTLKYEALEKRKLKFSLGSIMLNIDYKVIGDSRQTLSEFISHYKDCKCYRGDCDDFAMALLSSYEIMKQMASQRKGRFWDKLNLGLGRVQVAFVVEKGHADGIFIN